MTPPPHAGMPPLDVNGRPFSRFELWSPRLFYAPVWAYAAWLVLKYRSPTLPTLANPLIFAGGTVGESKSEVFALAGDYARRWIAPYASLAIDDAPTATRLRQALAAIDDAGLVFPLVAKPETGLRGAGVQPVRDATGLERYVADFPAGRGLMLQQLVPHEAEAGVFYIRHPEQPQGRIFSLTLKYAPYVHGDGRATLRQLIAADPRARVLADIYCERWSDRLDDILPQGAPFRLVFAGNHCRGAIFRDGGHLVTPSMTEAFDRIAGDVREFYFGRFDIRFRDIEALQRGEDFKIVEINGAGSEATHIWDRGMTLAHAYKVLFEQWREAFTIGDANRRRGFVPTSIPALFRAWRAEVGRGGDYPITL